MPFYYVIVPTGNCLTWRDCFFVICGSSNFFKFICYMSHSNSGCHCRVLMKNLSSLQNIVILIASIHSKMALESL